MIILIRRFSFIFMVQAFFVAGLQAEPVCRDFLAERNEKPAGVEYQSCKVHKGHQLHLRARYRLSGKIARSVASILKKKYKMGDLRFMCCGWQAVPTGGYSRMVKGVDYSYSIVMFSQEGVEKNWSKVAWFYIEVTLYPGTV